MIVPALLCDYYKTIHKDYYPKELTKVWAYFIPRQSRLTNIDYIIPFGIQGMIREYLMDIFNYDFFSQSWEDVSYQINRYLKNTLDQDYDISEFRKLHELGYLPIEIRLLIQEGEKCPIGCPLLEITNTHDDFAWVVNFLETLMSTCLWHPITSATIAYRYNTIVDRYCRDEGLLQRIRPYLIGDFSMRGQTSIESSKRSSAAFLTSFYKTSCIPAIDYLEEYYFTDCVNDIVGLGGVSTEHSIMCLLGQDEKKAIQNILDNTKDYSIISIVSDTWDYWNMLTNIYPDFMDILKKRNIRINIRPDSGDPVKIVAGYKVFEVKEHSKIIPKILDSRSSDLTFMDDDMSFYEFIYGDNCIKSSDGKYFIEEGHEYSYDCLDTITLKEITEEEALGSIESLFNIIGGRVNTKGYKILPNQFRLIYGDSITIERAEEIYKRLHTKRFSIENVVLCAGSYSLQYVTRDTFGFAQKITAAIINDVFTPVFKDPKTSDSTKKKSHKGLIRVWFEKGSYKWEDNQDTDFNVDKIIFKDGHLLKQTSLKDIRLNIEESLNLGKSL